jgi:YD repeat-containing protein
LEPAPKTCGVGNPIYPESGLKQQVELDYVSPDGALKMERTYRSDVKKFSSVISSAFLDYSTPNFVFQKCLNARYARTSHSNGQPIYDSYCFPFVATGTSNALLLKPSGRQVAFNQASGLAVPNANVNERAAKKTDAQGVVTWQIRGEDNTLEVYSAAGSLLSRTALDGRQVSYGYSDANTASSIAPRAGLMISATDAFGRVLQFRYNAAGLLAQMIDPAGQVYGYAYDTTSEDCLSGQCDRLALVQYPDQSIRQYLWNEAALTAGVSQPNALTGIVEVWPATASTPAQTVRAGSYGYDTSGRAISTQRANGLDSYAASGNNGYQITVTDPLSTQRTIGFSTLFNAAYPTSRSQPAGSGCAASTSTQTYDANGNTASADDFNGTRACYASDLSRNLETARVEGLSTSTTCSTVTAANATLPSGSRKVSTAWHPDWRIEVQRAEPGKLTTNVYNGQPDPFNGGTTASCAPSTALLPDGKPIAVLCKQVEQATTDANGRLGFTAALQSGVANRVQSWTYNSYGQVLTATDPLGHVSTYAYYPSTTANATMGDLLTVTNAAGQTTTYNQYNPHGQVLQSTDPNGVVTTNTYDLRQRLLSTSAAGETTSYAYDFAGQLITVTLPNGSAITNTYDAAHRLTQVTDGAGNTVVYTLDAMGNRIGEQIKDASGTLAKNIARSYDALNRLQSSSGAMR